TRLNEIEDAEVIENIPPERTFSTSVDKSQNHSVQPMHKAFGFFGRALRAVGEEFIPSMAMKARQEGRRPGIF
ncbi:MAG: hypothetical protein AAGB32_05760, partial [Pseudomonadota bacterium]